MPRRESMQLCARMITAHQPGCISRCVVHFPEADHQTLQMNFCLHFVYGSIGVMTGLIQSGNATGMHVDFAATRGERLYCYLEDRWHEGRGEGHKGGGGGKRMTLSGLSLS